ncbi:flagellar motor switch protein FliM [Enterococcus olivae]
MDQVLSQQEIDRLLNAMDSGEIDQETVEEENEQAKVKSYDFRRPTKLSKEYINTLHMIFEDFSKVGSNLLSTQLRTNVSFQLAAIEQISYDEFIHSIPKFTLLGLLQSKPASGIQMIEMNPQLCMLIVELLFGGIEVRQQANEMEEVSDKKSFTDIELAVLEEVVTQLAVAFENSWKDIVELSTELEGMDTNPQLLQNMSPNEPVVLVTFTVKILKIQTFINICIPYVFFEGIIDKLSFRNWFDSNQSSNQGEVDELQKSLNNVQLELEVLLGESQMNLSDFLHLAPGDVIKLDRKITDPLETFIEGKPFYRVIPGKKNDQLAIELIDKLEGDQKDE